MAKTETDRRLAERRRQRRGGRRSTDRPGTQATTTSCPRCGGAGTEAGSAEGGWWFVCAACDHLWDERNRGHNTR